MRIDKYRLLTIAFFLLASSCTKDPNTESEPDPNNPDNPQVPITYSFTNPINIKIINVARYISGYMLPKTQILGNYIYSTPYTPRPYLNDIKDILKIPIGSSNELTTSFKIFPGSLDFLYNEYAVNKYTLHSGKNISLFTVDKKGENIYIVGIEAYNYQYMGSKVEANIYKGNIASGSLTSLVTTEDLSKLKFLISYDLKCLKVDDAGNIYVASTAKNGCIVKITSDGAISELATDLINPGFFDIRGEDLYVPVDIATNGKVIKINKNNGSKSDIITNLTGPTNLVLDNHGNIVVRSLTSSNGGNYHTYDIYNLNGGFISNITDASGYSIMSNTYESTPLYIDENNNLYFYHADGVSSGGYTSNNPKGQQGIFKIALIRN